MRADRRARADREAGVGLIEVLVASVLLLSALGVALSTLDSQTRTSVYSQQRSVALDSLRQMATTFSKDVRSSTGATAATSSDLTVRTYTGGTATTNGTLTTVRWRAFADRLERTSGGTTRTFVVDLVSPAVFSYVPDTAADPATVRRVGISLGTVPDPRFPAVTLETEVEMRNV